MGDLLDCLLLAAEELQPVAKVKELTHQNEDERFLERISTIDPNSLNKKNRGVAKPAELNKPSVVHTGDTDSSDDECNKYNDFGKGIKHALAPSTSKDRTNAPAWKVKADTSALNAPVRSDVYTDPMFGIRVVNPLISSAALRERMVGREAVPMARLKRHVEKLNSDQDWVVAGVIVHKSNPKTSQKGSQFAVWMLSDLHGDLKTAGLFLFGKAYQELWKTAVGTTVGVLNPTVLDKKDGSKDEATLSINDAQKLMIFGQSKDLGKCKSVKKNGEQCNAFVNVNHCEFCIYHVKQEYQKWSRRSELQSNFSGRGLATLQNKVLGKNEVFYAGKSYTAIPAKKNKRLTVKDESTLRSLSGNGVVTLTPAAHNPDVTQKKKAANRLELSHKQRVKDLELLRKLGVTSQLNVGADKVAFKANLSTEVTPQESKNTALDVIAKLKATNANRADEIVAHQAKSVAAKLSDEKQRNNFALSSGISNKDVDLNTPISIKHFNRAKRNALDWVQRNGPIKKINPMSTKGTGKRPADDTSAEIDPKRRKIEENVFFSDRFKKIMAAASKHADLLDERDNEEKDKYFEKLEIKERMEEKMLSTYKVDCKAVRCLQCKYTSFSATDRCKAEKHPLKVFDATKKFFKCGACGNRTVTLDVVPTVACKNCGGGKWEKTSMMREKKGVELHVLSIRGGEQKFSNSVESNGNLNLLVPDDNVCKKFQEVGSKYLSRGFLQVEKRHATIYKKIKALLPRRESERRAHPLARHCDILSAIETRISMLNMTFMKYIENNLCCFIPGKVIDEIERVLTIVEAEGPPPRTHELLQELRDISSMAMEHFEEKILPSVKLQIEQPPIIPLLPSTSKSSKVIILQYAIAEEVRKVRKQNKFQKVQIKSLMDRLERFNRKIQRQNVTLKVQSAKIRDQERKLQEQSNKMQEQDSTIADIKKHMDEWGQKFSDLTAEVRAREDFNTGKSPNKQPPVEFHMPNIKPRKAQVLPKACNAIIKIEMERKRKANATSEVPHKLPRNLDTKDDKVGNLTDILQNYKNKASNEGRSTMTTRRSGIGTFISSSFESLLKNPITSIKSRKRKINEVLELDN